MRGGGKLSENQLRNSKPNFTHTHTWGKEGKGLTTD